VSASADGGPGNALHFDGVDDYVSVPHHIQFNSFPLSVTAWIRTSQAVGPVDLVNKPFPNAINGWGLSLSNGIVTAGYSLGFNNGARAGGANSIADGNWHHVAFVADVVGVLILVDGVVQGGGAWTGASGSISDPSPMRISGPATLNGDLDEVTIWNIALSPSQIQTNKNRSLTGIESGLVAYYRCDELFGMVLADSAPLALNNDGTLFNGPIFGPSTISPFSPGATTLFYDNFDISRADLHGTAQPAGTNTTAWFEWGTTTNYGNVTPAQAVGSGLLNTSYSQTISNVFGGTTYYFRAVASNALGVAYGANLSFTLPSFTLAFTNLPSVYEGSVAWGDYDNDGRLDFLLTGWNGPGGGLSTSVSQLWRNTGSGFANVPLPGVPGVIDSSVSWGDYDNDGRLDFLLTGAGISEGVSQLWRNTGSGFTNVPLPGVPGVSYSAVAWGDYDNDGRLDFLLTGQAGSTNVSQLWRNTETGFSNVPLPGVPAVQLGSVAWGDYDNDGRLDFLLTGVNAGTSFSQLWRNTGSGFTRIPLPGVEEVSFGSVAWGDYDNDGRLDLLLSEHAQLWRNTGSGFTRVPLPEEPGVGSSSAAWGDYDNDGRLDILFTGQAGGTIVPRLWRNTGSGFASIPLPGVPGVIDNSVAWGDYDNDGRLDFLLTGNATALNSVISQVWKNAVEATNRPPTAPVGLSVTATGTVATLSWNAGGDSQTPAAGLSYNLRIGTTPGGSDILAPASAASGLRRLPQLGNAQQGLTAAFNYTVGTPYYWSVQAVDAGFAGSPFAAEGNFKILSPTASVIQAQATNQPPGDLNGDGIVDQSELDTVLANYFSTSPFLQMTNVAGLSGTNVTFALTNDLAGSFTVEYTTNFADWYLLGPATPRYLVTDTNAPTIPQRYYRLRWP
jgi:hypothetical protein